MDLGLIGLGKMGGNMRERLRRGGHTVVGYDRNPELADVESLAAMVEALPSDSARVVWVMVPAGEPTRATIADLADLLGEGDLVVDGGNSKYTDDAVNAAMLAERGIGFVDCGVSGGVWGLKNGYALMCGGTDEDVAKVQPAFDALKPEDGGFVHAQMSHGDDRLMVGQEWSAEYKSPRAIGGLNTQTISINIDTDVDAHYRHARAAGAVIVTELADQFYGARNYACRDPEGHIWHVSQDTQTVSREEAEAATGLKIQGAM